MTNQELRSHVERWLAAYYERNRLSWLIQQNSPEMAKIKMLQRVLRLDELANQMNFTDE